MGIPGARFALWFTRQAFTAVHDCQRRSAGTVATDPIIGLSTARRGGDPRHQSSCAVSPYPALDKAKSTADLSFNGVPRQSIELRVQPLSLILCFDFRFDLGNCLTNQAPTAAPAFSPLA